MQGLPALEMGKALELTPASHSRRAEEAIAPTEGMSSSHREKRIARCGDAGDGEGQKNPKPLPAPVAGHQGLNPEHFENSKGLTDSGGA